MKSEKPPTGNELADVPLMQVTHDHLLNKAVKVTQPVDGYRVGSDAVLLSASIGTMTGRVLDLGAGVGGVCLCLAHRLAELQVTAVEKNADMAALCKETGLLSLVVGAAAVCRKLFDMLILFKNVDVALLGVSVLHLGCQEGLHHLHVPIRGGPVQWSLTPIIGLVHIRLRCQEGLHHLHVPIPGGPVQWSLTLIIGLVHIRLRCQEDLDHLHVPLKGGAVQ